MLKKVLTLAFCCMVVISCGTQKSISSSKLQILFTTARDGNFEVYTMNEDSSEVKNLTNHPKTDYGLGWSLNGKQILFYSNRTGNEDIWQMNNDGTSPINLTNTISNERAATYSPNGKTIAFISDRDQKTTDLYTMNANGSNVTRLTNYKSYCESATFTNDGKHIIYTMIFQKDASDKNENGEIFIIDADGKNLKQLTNRTGFDSGASVSPNGKKIAFYGKSETGNTDIFIMNLDGTAIQNLTNDKMPDYSPSWSPDGNWISFTSGTGNNYDIWKLNIVSKERKRLTTQPKRDETPFYKPKA